MQETWNKFAYDLCEAQQKNWEEDEYHSLIENQLQLLGWAKYKHEICHKPSIPIGNNNRIIPDILVRDEDEELFVIEVKRPVHQLTERERQQLESYVRQLKLKVGVYIGEHIEIFYDQPESRNAVSVLKIPLEIDNKRGAKFVELFSKGKFSKESIVAFCEERIQEMQRQENLNKIREALIADAQQQITESLKPFLKEKYGDTFSEDDIEKMLSSIVFSAALKELSQQVTSSIPFTPSSTIDTQQAENNSPRTYYYFNGKWYCANGFVLAFVKEYARQHPEASFSIMESIFRPELQGSTGVIRTMDYIRAKNYKGRRFFMENENILYDCHNIPYAVSTQWSRNNLPAVIALAKSLGFDTSQKEDGQTQVSQSPQSTKPEG